MYESVSQFSVKHIKVIRIRRVVLEVMKIMMRFFCAFRGSCGGAQTTAAAVTRMCRPGDFKWFFLILTLGQKQTPMTMKQKK